MKPDCFFLNLQPFRILDSAHDYAPDAEITLRKQEPFTCCLHTVRADFPACRISTLKQRIAQHIRS